MKIDIMAGPPGQAAETLARCRRYRVQAVAERVETAEQLGRCRELGFDLFQGYHLGRPQVISERALAPAHVTGLRLLSELSRPDLTMEELEAYVMRDPALSYRTLRAANSVASGLPRKLRSVRGALVLLGLRRLRSWIILMTICDTMPAGEEDLLSTVTRARACELLARQGGLVDGDEAFTVGLLSGLADLLGVAPEAVADRLDLDDDMAAALAGDAGRPLGEVLAAMLAHEAGDLEALAGSRFDPGPVSHAYLSAVDWSRLVREAFIPSRDTLHTAPA